ncbi:MAG TPA: FAD-binding oxidoreductase [Gemmataceae bacterium]|nr:FAD-binding oxidoreductase [Gemmataceae bacterium]
MQQEGPESVLQPGLVAEVSKLVQQASNQGKCILPLGGRTMLGFGLPPVRPGWGIDLQNLNLVVDYPARDMTITVQAGLTIAKFQEILAGENQRLPVDVPLPDRATLGGALAVNVSGPRRYGFGTFRDYVIGISVINDQGQETKAGGRVVKNVAGYDLCKLYVGSLGTLGIITQVTLKLKPRPERSTIIGLGCSTGQLNALLDALQRTRTRPVCITLLNDRAAGTILEPTQAAPPEKKGWLVLVGFEDNAEAVAWQVQQLQAELSAFGLAACQEWTDAGAEPIWRALIDFPHAYDAALSFKANILPRDVAVLAALAASFPERLHLQVHAGNGILHGHVMGDLTLERAQTMLRSLLETATAGQGNLIVYHCPPSWKPVLPIWGAPRADAWLMRAIKQKLDPCGIFNPGRFVDGI